MKVYANVMVKNEAILLSAVYEYWKNYPVDHWVFYDDNSTDKTVEVIKDNFKDQATIIADNLPAFNESHNRSRMLEYSRENGADFVVAIDADELMSANMVEHFNQVLEVNSKYDMRYYWFNVIGDLGHMRQDPLYQNNFRTFILPMKDTSQFDMSLWQYHTPRTPPVRLPAVSTKDAGFIHLQSINRKFYALKQLWYKHFEYKEYNHTASEINSKYDPVINNLDFQEAPTPPPIINGLSFDASVYDDLAEIKGYKSYIMENYVEDLVTFGKEYLV
tara:strand:+ start:7586 stop:8410 length:825 start_codon:yes stop_codon:yes gene_type:complete